MLFLIECVVAIQGYLPLQFTYQIPGTLDESMKRLARKKDILLNSEYSAAEMTTVRTLTYEKNAGTSLSFSNCGVAEFLFRCFDRSSKFV